MKIVIIDDHPLVRKGVEMVASLEPDLEFTGYASNGKEALELIAQANPDVALVDLRLPKIMAWRSSKKRVTPAADVSISY